MYNSVSSSTTGNTLIHKSLHPWAQFHDRLTDITHYDFQMRWRERISVVTLQAIHRRPDRFLSTDFMTALWSAVLLRFTFSRIAHFEYPYWRTAIWALLIVSVAFFTHFCVFLENAKHRKMGRDGAFTARWSIEKGLQSAGVRISDTVTVFRRKKHSFSREVFNLSMTEL